jgi:hypothetical protein
LTFWSWCKRDADGSKQSLLDFTNVARNGRSGPGRLGKSTNFGQSPMQFDGVPRYGESDDAAADLSLRQIYRVIAVVAALLASVPLILYEAVVIAEVIFNAATRGEMIETLDVSLIAIVALIIGLGIHALFRCAKIEKRLGFFSACLPTPTLGESRRTW